MQCNGKNISILRIDTLINQHTNTIKINNYDSIEGSILYAKNKAFRPTVGMKFISQYDWIIDMHEDKIYARKIKNREYKLSTQNYYLVNIYDTTLHISLLPVGETQYRPFSIIDSVNGVKVTMDNICQMKRLLNKENGFKDNEIVVLPPPEITPLKD